MKAEFKAKFLQHFIQKKKDGGFTLIELLVVVIIIGVLAAVALPNLLAQVGKARESEGKNSVGTVNRAQQSYHFEKQSFAGAGSLADFQKSLGVTLTTQYYQYTVPGALAANAATIEAGNTVANQKNDGIRPYAGAIAYSGGQYSQIICQGDNPEVSAAAANAATQTCAANHVSLR